MGSGMAARLLQAGHDVRVFNRTVARADALAALGAHPFDRPHEACDGADAVVAMVSDDSASQAVWLGSQGILTADLAPGASMIECSTLSYDWVMRLSEEVHARALRYIDAPVTGLPDDAASGRLALLVGADPNDLQASRLVLDAFSSQIIHFGPVGTGTIYKLLVNMLGAVQIASAAEAMAIAERAGLNLAFVADALASGQAASPQVVRNTQRIAADDHRNPAFTSQLRLKDVEYALKFTARLGVGSPFGALARRMFQQLCELGLSQENESKIIEVARRQPAEHR
jgi:3-hydroxyisobutyrate dehydrogenase